MSSYKTILGIILIILGEVLLVGAFWLLATSMPDEVLTLDIIVSSLIFGLMCYNAMAPWIRLSDSSHREVAQLGINWTAWWLYAIAAIAVMIIGNQIPWSFVIQLIVQAVLLLGVCAMLLGSMHAGDNTARVHKQETAMRADVDSMRNAMRRLQQIAAGRQDLDPEITAQINGIAEDTRYISPINSFEGQECAHQFISLADNIAFNINAGMVQDLPNLMRSLRQVLDNYRNIYSR